MWETHTFGVRSAVLRVERSFFLADLLGPAGTGVRSEVGAAGLQGRCSLSVLLLSCCSLGPTCRSLFKGRHLRCVPSDEIRSVCLLSSHTMLSLTVLNAESPNPCWDKLGVGTTVLYQGCFLSQFGSSML